MTFLEEWERCKPWISAALSYAEGTHDMIDVMLMIAQGKAQFWAYERCAFVTEITRFPKLSCLNFWLCGGDLKEILEREPEIVAWGKLQGCSRALICGREGWKRTMAPFGYRAPLQLLMKDIA